MKNQSKIIVYPDKISHRISPLTTGANIEDVNHEIYGGIYSQMIFGESFEEPPDISQVLDGFKQYGGSWIVEEGELKVLTSLGPKLIADQEDISDGEIGVDLYFEEHLSNYGNAGILVRVNEPATGPNKFIGYEISVDPSNNIVFLSSHRFDNQRLAQVEHEIPSKKWIKLSVKMVKNHFEVYVDEALVLQHTDMDLPINSGNYGLRIMQRNVRFRNFWFKTENKTISHSFQKNERATKLGDISGMWREVIKESVVGHFALESRDTFNGRQSQRIKFVSGQGEIGIDNRGLNCWGMNIVSGKAYEGYIWIRSEKPVEVFVSFESKDGSKIYAEDKVNAVDQDWKNLNFTLIPDGNDTNGRFAIKLKQPGSILVGHAFLQPGEWGRYKSLPVRKDIVEGLISQGIKLLRYGGSMVDEAQEYRWKNMIGPRDQRPPYHGHWYPHSSNGWGIIDFLDLCEAAQFEYVPSFNIDETAEDMSDFIEYVNGSPDSSWGKKRVETGHVKPYHLKYIQIGNEERIDENYYERFKILASAIWAKDPNIVVLVGDYWYPNRIKDPYNTGVSSNKTLAFHERILQFAKTVNKTVWFDVHIANNDPRDPDRDDKGIPGLRDYINWLEKLNPGADFKVVVLEENAKNHAMIRALSHAHAINEIQRIPHALPMVCAANCLQPYQQNDNDWDQGLLFFTPSQVWGQPPYYVTKMVSENYLPICVMTETESINNSLDVISRRSEDGKKLSLQIVNLEDSAIDALVELKDFTPSYPAAKAIQISGDLDAVNTPENPNQFIPREEEYSLESSDGGFIFQFPPNSFTILRIE